MFALLSFLFALYSTANAQLSQSTNSKRGYNVVGAVVAAVVLGAIIFIGVCVMVCCRKQICRCFRSKKGGQSAVGCDADGESLDVNSLKARSQPSLKEKDEKQTNVDPEKVDQTTKAKEGA